MKTTFIRSIVLAGVMLVGGATFALAAEAPKEDAASVNKLITALVNSDHAAFVSDGEAAFKAMKQGQFESFAAKISPVLKSGYEVTYLGTLNQKGYRMSLWKVSLKAGGDDLLASLSMRDGKVGGFFIR
jgi:hypothetical protein